MDNPFARLALRQYTSKPGRVEDAFALTHGQVAVVDDLMGELRSSVRLATYGVLRLSELCGLSIEDVEFPADGGPGSIYVRQTLTDAGLRPRGKTDTSVGTRVSVPGEVLSVVWRYIEEHRATPDPAGCEACRSGVRHHRGERGTNPHRGCDFHAGGPLYVDPRTGARISRERFRHLFGLVISAAGLDGASYVPTPHTLRASGATYLLQQGVDPHTVKLQGRWSSLDTVLKHYLRPLDGLQHQAAEEMDKLIRATDGSALGPDESDNATIRRLRLENEGLRAQLAAHEAAGRELPTVRLPRRKPAFDERDLQRELPLSKNETDLCRRLGTTGAKNTRLRIRRMIADLGLRPPW